MKAIWKPALVLLAGMTLAACGGGGSSSQGNNTSSSTPGGTTTAPGTGNTGTGTGNTGPKAKTIAQMLTHKEYGTVSGIVSSVPPLAVAYCSNAPAKVVRFSNQLDNPAIDATTSYYTADIPAANLPCLLISSARVDSSEGVGRYILFGVAYDTGWSNISVFTTMALSASASLMPGMLRPTFKSNPEMMKGLLSNVTLLTSNWNQIEKSLRADGFYFPHTATTAFLPFNAGQDSQKPTSYAYSVALRGLYASFLSALKNDPNYDDLNALYAVLKDNPSADIGLKGDGLGADGAAVNFINIGGDMNVSLVVNGSFTQAGKTTTLVDAPATLATVGFDDNGRPDFTLNIPQLGQSWTFNGDRISGMRDDHNGGGLEAGYITRLIKGTMGNVLTVRVGADGSIGGTVRTFASQGVAVSTLQATLSGGDLGRTVTYSYQP